MKKSILLILCTAIILVMPFVFAPYGGSPPGSSGGSGSTGGATGGGGGGDIVVEGIDLPSNELLLGRGESAIIKFKGQDHRILINDVDFDSVTITVSPPNIMRTLVQGRLGSIDLTGDGIFNMVIRFNGVVDGRASLTYAFLKEEIVTKETPTEEKRSEEGQREESGAITGEVGKAVAGAEKQMGWIWVVAFIVLVVISVLIYILFVNKY